MRQSKEADVIFILGAPRSGTTWLAKIFDSHPDVVYRHEPDTVLRSAAVPVLCSDEDCSRHGADARDYIAELLNVRTIKAAGSFPLFAKNYRRKPAEYVRRLMILAAKAPLPGGLAAIVSRRPIPDFVRRSHPENLTYVVKSVSARGRVKVFAEAMPSSRFIFLVRHPCGQVASMLGGIQNGKFERAVPFGEILGTREAGEAGLDAERFERFDLVEKCAWHWAILNQKAANDLPGGKRAMVVRYEDLCSAPEEVGRRLFGFAGLDWASPTETFVWRSTHAGNSGEFYGVNRNSLAAATKWQGTLDADTKARILAIAARVPIGARYAA